MDDLTIAFFSFDGHRDFVCSGLRSIYEHAPKHKEIILVWDDFVRWYPVDFDKIKDETKVDFRVVLQSEIHPWSEAISRWGWIKQQLAKMSCYEYTNTRYTWIVDGDVCIKRAPDLFHPDGRPYLRYHLRSTSPGYVDFIKQYLNLDKIFEHDFVGSTCLFDNHECKKINQHALKTSGMSLIDCVNDCITRPNHGLWPFSEFETYGTWIYNTCLDTHVLAPRNWNYVLSESNLDCPIQIGYPQKDKI